MSKALTVVAQQNALAYGDMLRPRSINEAMDLAKMLASSDMVPKDYKGKPGNVIAAVQMGAELGLAPMQALQNIAVINGRTSVWGDALLALCQAHPDFEWIQERLDGEGEARIAVCEIKRKRNPKPTVGRFSVADAKKAGLWGKQGPWSQYPDRMLKMRARGFACRDAFADALRGLHSAEEAQDMPAEKRVAATVASAESAPAPQLPAATLASVLAGIANAATPEELASVADVARALPTHDRNQAKAAYKRRAEELRNQPPAQEVPHADEGFDPNTGEVYEAKLEAEPGTNS